RTASDRGPTCAGPRHRWPGPPRGRRAPPGAGGAISPDHRLGPSVCAPRQLADTRPHHRLITVVALEPEPEQAGARVHVLPGQVPRIGPIAFCTDAAGGDEAGVSTGSGRLGVHPTEGIG